MKNSNMIVSSIRIMVFCNLLLFTQNSALAVPIQFDLEVTGFVEGKGGMGQNDFAEVNWDFFVANATPIIRWTPPTFIGVYGEDKRIEINETFSWTGDFATGGPDPTYTFEFNVEGEGQTSQAGAEARWFLEGSLLISGPIEEYWWQYEARAEVDGIEERVKDSFPNKPPSASAFIELDTLDTNQGGARAFSLSPFPKNEKLFSFGNVGDSHNAFSKAEHFVEFTAVPEPSTYILIISGLVGLVFLRRRMPSPGL